jgi:hypothetical protein
MVFDRTKLKINSLKERCHDINIDSIQRLENKKYYNDSLKEVALHIVEAMKKGKGIILMMGAHVIRSGVQKYLIDLLERGYISRSN